MDENQNKKQEDPKPKTKFQEAMAKYEQSQKMRKAIIRLEPSRWKRFWKWVWFFLSWPFRYIWAEVHDWRFVVIFVATMAVVGSEVWVPLVLAWIFWGDESFRITMLSVSGTCEAFWLAPFTPFLPLCIAITMGIKSLIEKIKEKRTKKMKNKEDSN